MIPTFAALAAGCGYQYWAAKQDDIKFPPPGQMVDIGGYQLHIQTKGCHRLLLCDLWP